jgi:hypothetical protein
MHDEGCLGSRNVGLVLGAGTHQPMHSLSVARAAPPALVGVADPAAAVVEW